MATITPPPPIHATLFVSAAIKITAVVLKYPFFSPTIKLRMVAANAIAAGSMSTRPTAAAVAINAGGKMLMIVSMPALDIKYAVIFPSPGGVSKNMYLNLSAM